MNPPIRYYIFDFILNQKQRTCHAQEVVANVKHPDGNLQLHFSTIASVLNELIRDGYVINLDECGRPWITSTDRVRVTFEGLWLYFTDHYKTMI